MIRHTDDLANMLWHANHNEYEVLATYGSYNKGIQANNLTLVERKDLLKTIQEIDFKVTRKLAIHEPLIAGNQDDINFYIQLMYLVGDADILVNIDSDWRTAYSSGDPNGRSVKHISHSLQNLNRGFFLFAKYNVVPKNLQWMQNIGARYL
jgi:hypothetical protein